MRMLGRSTWHAAHDTVAAIKQRRAYTHGALRSLSARRRPGGKHAARARGHVLRGDPLLSAGRQRRPRTEKLLSV